MRDVWNALHSFYACFLRPRETVIGLLGDKKNGHKMWVGAVQHAKKKTSRGKKEKKTQRRLSLKKQTLPFCQKERKDKHLKALVPIFVLSRMRADFF